MTADRELAELNTYRDCCVAKQSQGLYAAQCSLSSQMHFGYLPQPCHWSFSQVLLKETILVEQILVCRQTQKQYSVTQMEGELFRTFMHYVNTCLISTCRCECVSLFNFVFSHLWSICAKKTEKKWVTLKTRTIPQDWFIDFALWLWLTYDLK